MNNKGFTLVELLSVIVLMAILMSVAVPSITNVVETFKVQSYCEKIDTIEAAALLYAEDNYGDLKDKTLQKVNTSEYGYEIPVKVLLDDDLISKDNSDCDVTKTDSNCITDPRDNSVYLDNKTFSIYTKNKRLYVIYNFDAVDAQYKICGDRYYNINEIIK